MINKNIVTAVLLLLINLSCSDVPVQPNEPQLNTEWINIPAGNFSLGEEKEIISLSYNFQIMKFEVTNAQYVDFLNNAWANESISLSEQGVSGYYEDENVDGDEYLFYSFGNYLPNPGSLNYGKISFTGQKFTVNEKYKNHPVVLVTYYGASAFAKYYGLRLPHEYEWEKAARGETGWNYSFGDTVTSQNSNFIGSNDPFEAGTTPVGYFNGSSQNGFQTLDSPSIYGVYDLTGNAHEWTDSYNTYPGHHRMIRGGSWFFSGEEWLSSWFRHNHSPGFSCEYIGFRCVKG